MKLFVFGLGDSVRTLLRLQGFRFSRVAGTVRSPEAAAALRARGIEALPFDARPGGACETEAVRAALRRAEVAIASIPPGEGGDPALAAFGDALRAAPNLARLVYLSTVGVYGDRGGGTVDARDAPNPGGARGRARLAAEEAWSALARDRGAALARLRIAGIYGPGRNALRQLREGTARRIEKPGQVFNRVHVADVAGLVAAALSLPDLADEAFDAADDEPSPPGDVILHAAALLGVEPPPAVPFADAELSPMARSFYGESKRVANARTKARLRYAFAFPTYREGLAALMAAGEGAPA